MAHLLYCPAQPTSPPTRSITSMWAPLVGSHPRAPALLRRSTHMWDPPVSAFLSLATARTHRELRTLRGRRSNHYPDFFSLGADSLVHKVRAQAPSFPVFRSPRHTPHRRRAVRELSPPPHPNQVVIGVGTPGISLGASVGLLGGWRAVRGRDRLTSKAQLLIGLQISAAVRSSSRPASP